MTDRAPLPPSLRGLIPPELAERAIELDGFDAVVSAVTDWQRACEPAQALLSGKQLEDRIDLDRIHLLRMIEEALDARASPVRRIRRSADLVDRIHSWAKFSEPGRERRCRRPYGAVYVAGTSVTSGVMWCKSATCDRCGHQKAANYLTSMLVATANTDTLVVSWISHDERKAHRVALTKWSRTKSIRSGGIYVPTPDNVVVCHDALLRRPWGSRRESAMTIEAALDLLMAAFDRKIRSSPKQPIGNTSLVGSWKPPKVATFTSFLESRKVDTFRVSGALSRDDFAEAAKRAGLVGSGGKYRGSNQERIDCFLSDLDAEDVRELNSRRRRQ